MQLIILTAFYYLFTGTAFSLYLFFHWDRQIKTHISDEINLIDFFRYNYQLAKKDRQIDNAIELGEKTLLLINLIQVSLFWPMYVKAFFQQSMDSSLINFKNYLRWQKKLEQK